MKNNVKKLKNGGNTVLYKFCGSDSHIKMYNIKNPLEVFKSKKYLNGIRQTPSLLLLAQKKNVHYQ